jgi:hypothetical protein
MDLGAAIDAPEAHEEGALPEADKVVAITYTERER